MDNYIKVTGDNGVDYIVEVLDIFGVTNYPDKEYILYTRNNEVDNDNIEAFVSILKQENDNYYLLNIEDEEEWKQVSKAIEEMEDSDE